MALRILFCTLGYHPVSAGGAERQARLQAEELVRRGHAVTVVSPRLQGTRSGTINGVRVQRLPAVDRRILRTLTYLPCLAAFLLLRTRRFDVIHVHHANLQADVAAVAARLFRRPMYVKVVSGGPIGEVQRFRRFARLTRYVGIRSALRVQAISDEIEADVLSIGVPPARVVRIPNGVDVSDVGGDGEPAVRDGVTGRAALDLPTGDVVVLFAGRFAAYKGLDDLIAAWGQLRTTAGRCLVLVGRRSDAGTPVGATESAGVLVRAWTADIEAYLRVADIFVLPSHAEAMSNALLEAMARGIPPIVTRVGAAETMIEDGGNGILVRSGDREGLARALDRLIDDPDLRGRIGAAAAASIRATYDIRRVVDGIEAAYLEMVLPSPKRHR